MKFVKTIIMLLAFSVMAFGSEQRVGSLGGNAGFWADDDANISMFPATMNNWNIAQVSGVNGDHSAYVLWGSGTKWGFSWDESASNDMVNLMWGNGTYGVNFGLGMGAEDDGIAAADGGDGVDAMSSMNIDIGFGMNMGFGEVGAGYSMGNYDDGDAATADDPASSNIWFNLRRDQAVWLFDKMLVNFSTASTNSTDWETGNADAQGTMNLGVSCFTHMDISDGATGLFAMGFGYESVSNEMYNKDNSSSSMMFPNFTFAVESSMTDWATARVGVTSGYTLSGSSTTGNPGVTATEQGPSEPTFSFGLGFNYGSFNLDIDVQEDLFTNPVQHVVGQENLGNNNSTATITYTW